MPRPIKRFEAAFKKLNKQTLRTLGIRLFKGAKHIGDGVLEITATELWLEAPQSDKESNLKTIVGLWERANNFGPVVVNIVDSEGEKQMSMSSEDMEVVEVCPDPVA